ncbi:hypothetical protein [Clostridium sp. FP1]|uniref:hypothetical protein n=1 Tax=Clostridium sp. FP1 TaxID=2724076 RepID=UPI0013E94757|nr:hypothetical protein [Clostridium sp. FP1]MBZ9633844.1 hypothetical protein [Clostridium sp. FP1]
MFKLIKYELRSNFLTILGSCISVIIANLFLMTKRDTWDVAVPGFSACIIIGAIIVIFISSLKIMSKYLHGDEGYLFFTLPQSGVSIIASRLITALIQISIVLFVSILMFNFTVPDKTFFNLFKDFKLNQVFFSMIVYIWSVFSSLTFIYFCMVIGKVALKGKKLGKIGSFIIFIVLSIALSWLSTKITSIFPQTLNFGGSSIANNFGASNSGLSISGGRLNIASTIFDIITFIGFFISTTYLIDKKLDLS